MKPLNAILYICAAMLTSVAVHSSWNTGPALGAHISTLVSVMATLLGFTVSSTALLYAVADTRLARNLQRTGHFKDLLQTLFNSAFFFFFAVILGIIYILLPPSLTYKDYNLIRILGCFFALIVGVSLFKLIPLAKKFWLLLSNIQPSSPESLE